MPHIFISYSKKNKDYAQLLKAELIRQGFSVWIDDVIEPSEDWWRNIRQGIKDSTAFTLIMTPESETSHYVGLELLHALEYKKPIFPLLRAGDINLLNSDTWSRIANIQYTDVREGQLPPDTFYTKLKAFQKRIEQAAQPNDGWTPQVEVTPPPQPVSPQTQAELTNFVRRAAQVKQEIETPKPAQPLIWGVENILPPPFEWVYIPPGLVVLKIDKNDHTFELGPYNISKYPVTNAQFEVFIQAEDGYRNPNWWNFDTDARLWRDHNKVPLPRAFFYDNHPRANINYCEAMAFCNWLDARFNSAAPNLPHTAITLPTEQQWVRAAQGDDKRKYPWGNEFNPQFCNTEESRIRRTTPVTQYPNGASPYGVMDMIGNVWEWCKGKSDPRENVTERMCGGSWIVQDTQIDNGGLDVMTITAQSEDTGFRIVMTNN